LAGVAAPIGKALAGDAGGRVQLGIARGGPRSVILLVTVDGGPPIATDALARFGAGLAAHGAPDVLALAVAVPCGEVVCGP
jgi:hypothetical protein